MQYFILLFVTTLLGTFSSTISTVQADVTPATTVLAPTATDKEKITDEQYRNASATELAKMVRENKVTSTELIHHAFSVLAQDNPSLNAVVYTREQEALQEASQLKDSGQPFYGVPLLVKGLMQLISGGPNTNGLLPSAGATTSATLPITKAFQNAGFIVIGVTNFPEMGLINVTTSKLYGSASNPWNTDYNPGGSSGGAAASAADGMVPLAGGNDAGGSIRIPASWTGLIGLKPTQGVITGDSSTPGAVNFAETKTMTDTTSLFNSLLNPKKADQVAEASSDLKGMTIAYSTKSPVGTPVSDDAVNAVKAAVTFLKSKGFNMVEVDSPIDGQKLMEAYYLRSTSSGSTANFIVNQKTKQNMTFDQVSPMAWALYQASKKLPKEATQTYQNELNHINQQMVEFHKTYPLYLTPTTATTAPRNDDPTFLPEYVEKIRNMDSLDSNQQMQLIYDAWLHGLSKSPFTQLANLSGEPAISLPTYVSSSGLPLGIQFEAAQNQDRLLLKIGDLFEQNGLFKILTHTTKSPSTEENSSASQSSTPTKESSSTKTPTKSTTTTIQKYGNIHINSVVYATKKINLYRQSTFNSTQIKATYSKQKRTNRPMFVVTKIVKNRNGLIRYYVRDVNHQSNSNNKLGYITARKDYVVNTYYTSLPDTHKIKVIAKHAVEYQNKDLTKRVKSHKKNTVFKIKKIVSHNLTTRYELSNGHYVTANKKFVIFK